MHHANITLVVVALLFVVTLFAAAVTGRRALWAVAAGLGVAFFVLVIT